jgi:hypothetical protein
LFEAAGAVTSKSGQACDAHARTDFLGLHRKNHTRSGVGGEFDHRMATACESILDDFAHGLIGGIRLSNDPFVNIVSTITNSPGATQQSGFGHLNQSVTQQQ